MTKETKIVFSLSDINCIRLVCTTDDCGEPVYFSLRKFTKAPQACPHCGEIWAWNGSTIKELVFVSRFRELLKDLDDNKKPRAVIQFEIEGDDD